MNLLVCFFFPSSPLHDHNTMKSEIPMYQVKILFKIAEKDLVEFSDVTYLT
jgi:hypothetical protein